jgi:hypothetical protein
MNEENKNFIVKLKDSNEQIEVQSADMQNSSTSEEETLSEFVNSRTIIKP